MKQRLLMIIILAVFSALMLPCPPARACQVKIEREAAPDAAPLAPGSVDVLTVTFTKTHQNCALPLEKTEFKAEGMEIVGATPWKEVQRGTFVRKFKVKYLQPGEATFNVIRNCYRGCANEVLKITVGQ